MQSRDEGADHIAYPLSPKMMILRRDLRLLLGAIWVERSVGPGLRVTHSAGIPI